MQVGRIQGATTQIGETKKNTELSRDFFISVILNDFAAICDYILTIPNKTAYLSSAEEYPMKGRFGCFFLYMHHETKSGKIMVPL